MNREAMILLSFFLLQFPKVLSPNVPFAGASVYFLGGPPGLFLVPFLFFFACARGVFEEDLAIMNSLDV